MIALPNIKPSYPQEILNVLPPAERMAANYGVDRRFLRFASPPYVTSDDEQYALHQYTTMRIVDAYGDVTEIGHDVQYEAAKSMLDSGVLWGAPAGVIVINSPYYFFNSSDKDPDGGAEAFLAHLLCSLAHRVANRTVSGINVNYLETMSLDHSREYALKPKHLLIWGVCTEHFNSYDCQKTIQFLHTFRHYTRILLTSVTDMGELLTKLHLHVSNVTHLFNLDRRMEMVKEEQRQVRLTKKKRPSTKSREPKPTKIEEENLPTTVKRATAKKKKTKTVQRKAKSRDLSI
jgi:hypothetical protein